MTDACFFFANSKPNSKFLFAGDCPTLIQPLNRKGNYFDLKQISDIVVYVCVCVFPEDNISLSKRLSSHPELFTITGAINLHAERGKCMVLS